MRYLAARGAAVLLFASLAVRAADIAGSWKLAYTTENGLTREATLDLKLDGDRLSGTLSSERGSARIEDGKLSGDEVQFSLLRRGNGDEIRVTYQGKVEGGTIKLKMRFGRREPVEIVAKRIL